MKRRKRVQICELFLNASSADELFKQIIGKQNIYQMVHEVYLIIRLEVSISNKWDTVVHNLCRDTDRLCLRVEELLYIYKD